MAAKTDKTARDEKRNQKERLENKARGMIRAGANFDEIASNLGISPRKARQIAVSSLTRKARPTSEQQRKIDFEVLRGLALKLQKAAFEGDVAAARQFLDVQDRMAGLNVPGDDTLPLVEAFDKTVAACASEGLDADGKDAALVSSGRRIAFQIDQVVASGHSLEVTKALYLLPHLKGILADMQATPAARLEAAANAKDKGEAAEATALGKMRASRDRIRLVKSDSEQAG